MSEISQNCVAFSEYMNFNKSTGKETGTSVHWIYYNVEWKLKKQLVQTRVQENKNATLEIILPHYTSPGGKKLKIDWIALFSLKIGR